MKFILEEKYIKFGNHGESSIISTPIGNHNIKINTITKVATKQLGIKCQCDISKLVGPIVLLETGIFGTVRICGDIIITCIDMGYDLSDKNDCKKIKKDKDLINKRYAELLEEKPKLFDISAIKENSFSTTSDKDLEKNESDEVRYFYQESCRNYSEEETTCDYCSKYETIIDSSLFNLLQFELDLQTDEGHRWAYTAFGTIFNDMKEDSFYLDHEPTDISIMHLFREEQGFLGKSPKKIKSITICENCFQIFKWKYKVDKVSFVGEIESGGIEVFTKIKTDLNLMYKVEDYSDFINAIFNTESKENVNLIISKLNMLPKHIEDINGKIRNEKNQIINLLKDKGVKITVSDITTMLRRDDRDTVEFLCKTLYEDGEIDFAGNNRYYIMSEDKKVPDNTPISSAKTSKEDIESELKRYKKLLDEGLITKDAYEAKMNKILDI